MNMEYIKIILQAVSGIKNSPEGTGYSARLTGIAMVLSSVLVYWGVSNGINLPQEEVIKQLTPGVLALGTIWYSIGAIRASADWVIKTFFKKTS